MDNIKRWTGLSMEESVRMTEDRDKWRKYVHGVWPTLGSRTAKEQNRTASAVKRSAALKWGGMHGAPGGFAMAVAGNRAFAFTS